jgi:hypothetical protein
VRVQPGSEHSASASSASSNITASAAAYYDRIQEQLDSLLAANEEEEIVEKGAAKSALTIVNQLRELRLAPPELSWHGGDAVVMLWALGDTTYAITVTDGELGYVVRQNRKPIRIADSISINAFRLEDLR